MTAATSPARTRSAAPSAPGAGASLETAGAGRPTKAARRVTMPATPVPSNGSETTVDESHARDAAASSTADAGEDDPAKPPPGCDVPGGRRGGGCRARTGYGDARGGANVAVGVGVVEHGAVGAGVVVDGDVGGGDEAPVDAANDEAGVVDEAPADAADDEAGGVDEAPDDAADDEAVDAGVVDEAVVVGANVTVRAGAVADDEGAGAVGDESDPNGTGEDASDPGTAVVEAEAAAELEDGGADGTLGTKPRSGAVASSRSG
mmetsp:Transcript_10068/g.40813  ORF Transcript_10068/g.40813 Transcript_10068/m.40813 type:complete len:262 (+) Transcript_10068:161-946(+)